MFLICRLSDWQGVGGDRFYKFAEDGIAAIRERERLGLPSGTQGWIEVLFRQSDLVDRRAAEAWPEALDSNADLPGVSIGVNRQRRGAACEFADMVRAGIVVADGPAKNGDEVRLSFRLACSPFELVCWRRAWAAEQNAKVAQEKLAAAEEEGE